ncbi:MAG: acid phosphatase [Caulobacter sp.]|nr:acid phosphatase [Caulobacter sp.]
MRLRLAATAAIIVLGAGVAMAADAPATAPAPKTLQTMPTAPQGYLSDAALNTLKILTPPPSVGGSREANDKAIFLETRKLEGSERWKLAQHDDDSAGVLADFSCAIGAVLSPTSAPKTWALLMKMRFDVSRAVNQPKDVFQRKRPYLLFGGNICIAKTDLLAKSPDYPSGHVTWGFSTGLMLAEAVPDRATDILVRGRAFGESRLVCGVHSFSAVEAGRTNAAVVMAALHGSSDFRADVDGVRAEMAALRANGPKPDAAMCAAEFALTAKAPFQP